MATRYERVVLDLEDRFTGPTLRAAAAAQVLDKSLDSLSGDAVRTRRSLDDTEKSTGKLGSTANRQSKEIDKLSGRLAVWRDVAITLGPALIPLGAGGVTAIAGLAAEFGAAAGGAGVMILALKGVGKGLDALNKFQLDPTQENLEKLNEEMRKLGPEGSEFVYFLDSLTPQFKELQNAARAGMFPGMEEGLSSLVDLLPQVERIVSSIASEVGGLAAGAGDALAGEKFSRFFDYLETDAAPILGNFARSLGNVTAGFADLLVDFAPLTRGFSNGLEDMTARFADWAHTLDESQSFQDFLDYLRETGPQAVEFLGALSDALVGIIRAAAPLGQTVLPILTNLAQALAAIANSPIGGPLFTAAAGFIALSRAVKILEPSVTKLNDAFLDIRTSPDRASTAIKRFSGAAKVAAGAAGMGLFIDSMQRGSGATRTFEGAIGGALAGFSAGGPWGAAIGTAVGLLSGFGGAADDTSAYVDALTDSLNRNTGALTGRSEVVAAQYLESQGLLQQAQDLGLGLDTVTQAALGNKDAMALVVAKQRELADVTNPDGSVNQGLYEQRQNADELASKLRGLAGDTRTTVASQRRILDAADGTSDALARQTKRLQEWRNAAKAARAGARDTASKFITLGDSVDDAKTSLHDWISDLQKQAKALQDFGRNAQRAAKRGLDEGLIAALEKMGPAGALRMKQLANATDSELKRANKAWRDGQKAIRDYVDIHVPPKPLTVEERQALAAIAAVKRELASIDRDVYINVHARTPNAGGFGAQIGYAGGGYTGRGGKYEPAGVVHRREFVFSSEATDGNEAFLSSLHRSLRGYASGGYVGPMPARAQQVMTAPSVRTERVEVVRTIVLDAGSLGRFVHDTATGVTRQEIASDRAYQSAISPRNTTRRARA